MPTTWLMREQRLAQVPVNQSINQSEKMLLPDWMDSYRSMSSGKQPGGRNGTATAGRIASLERRLLTSEAAERRVHTELLKACERAEAAERSAAQSKQLEEQMQVLALASTSVHAGFGRQWLCSWARLLASYIQCREWRCCIAILLYGSWQGGFWKLCSASASGKRSFLSNSEPHFEHVLLSTCDSVAVHSALSHPHGYHVCQNLVVLKGNQNLTMLFCWQCMLHVSGTTPEIRHRAWAAGRAQRKGRSIRGRHSRDEANFSWTNQHDGKSAQCQEQGSWRNRYVSVVHVHSRYQFANRLVLWIQLALFDDLCAQSKQMNLLDCIAKTSLSSLKCLQLYILQASLWQSVCSMQHSALMTKYDFAVHLLVPVWWSGHQQSCEQLVSVDAAI